jgi:hypothetical protein
MSAIYSNLPTKTIFLLDMALYICNSRVQRVEAGVAQDLKPAWVHSEILFQKFMLTILILSLEMTCCQSVKSVLFS